jgi:hypothetical protein
MKAVLFLIIFSISQPGYTVEIHNCSNCTVIENQDGGTINIDRRNITNYQVDGRTIVTGNNPTVIENQAGAKVNLEGYGRCGEYGKYYLCQ